ncbi:hypothetical protein Ahy_B06g085279 [Arachis hypogaea]|uniref:Knottin scorpion toxin-like domain-containing protein n=1 Tax=Arachis hypogaea TaxID=3818 RepID=A0A444YU16_ARAHY|nr:hypothetical protein Ahy_B06g085279 [Arachis hypogaea]
MPPKNGIYIYGYILAPMEFAEADACPKVSTTWSGPCELEGCIRQCIVAESALFGACDHSQTTCFCFFQC